MGACVAGLVEHAGVHVVLDDEPLVLRGTHARHLALLVLLLLLLLEQEQVERGGDARLDDVLEDRAVAVEARLPRERDTARLVGGQLGLDVGGRVRQLDHVQVGCARVVAGRLVSHRGHLECRKKGLCVCFLSLFTETWIILSSFFTLLLLFLHFIFLKLYSHHLLGVNLK